MRRLGHARNLFTEIKVFARENRIFWLVPLILILALAMLLVAGSQLATPFIYHLF